MFGGTRGCGGKNGLDGGRKRSGVGEELGSTMFISLESSRTVNDTVVVTKPKRTQDGMHRYCVHSKYVALLPDRSAPTGAVENGVVSFVGRMIFLIFGKGDMNAGRGLFDGNQEPVETPLTKSSRLAPFMRVWCLMEGC